MLVLVDSDDQAIAFRLLDVKITYDRVIHEASSNVVVSEDCLCRNTAAYCATFFVSKAISSTAKRLFDA